MLDFTFPPGEDACEIRYIEISPGEVFIYITLPVEVSHIPSRGVCMWLLKDIYKTPRESLNIYLTSSGGVPHSLQGRMHVYIIQYTRRLPGKVDHRFTFPPRGGYTWI